MNNYEGNISKLINLREDRVEFLSRYMKILDSYTENQKDSEELFFTNKGKGRVLDSYPEDTEESVKKPRTGESITDDYADPSLKAGDWTEGDY